jgi:bacillithiol biosynthesis cysteine-adding enzyme BshC
MQSVSTQLPYHSTGYFSTIVLDYLNGQQDLKPFYEHPVSVEGIKAAIVSRKQFGTNRALLLKVMEAQYKNSSLSEKQQMYLQQLAHDNTFTICTAHQPNIFTGHLYFIYKILHAIKLADTLREKIPDMNFVPVYYMGSEDADLEELGQVTLDGVKYKWATDQKGAVGRMISDKALIQLIGALSGQLLVHPFGKETVDLMTDCYRQGVSIEEATFTFVNHLFAEYGLLILLPDNPLLKSSFSRVMEKELMEQFSHEAVQQTVAALPAKYKVQAAGRELNLFYLKEDARERIELLNGAWSVVNSETTFNRQEILQELQQHPERFSPNVILRPVFQEWLLPNVAFIGGGGEIAYWLELKKVFEAAGVPYPVLVLRNSFLLINKKQHELVHKLGFSAEQLFLSETALLNLLVKRESTNQLSLEKEKTMLAELYAGLKTVAASVDATLATHTVALHQKAVQKLEALEKKMLRAEKRKFEAEQRQLHKLKQQLFPANNLQERVDNFMLYYAASGKEFLQQVHEHSLSLEQALVVLTEK